MAIEIERKFLVENDGWRALARASQRFEQGYFSERGPASVRVRIAGQGENARADINIKAAKIGRARAEYEYPIPWPEARAMLDELAVGEAVVKTRHWLEYAGHTWEIDVFEGANAPLVVAEVELEAVDAALDFPDWLGAEITDDARYYNHALAFNPYRRWGDAPSPRIDIGLGTQTLRVIDNRDREIRRYRVSTAAQGGGEQNASHRTPRGRHRIRALIGAGAPSGTVFVGRRATGEIYTPELAEQHPGRDWILTRILWLCGEQVGFNRLGAVDTMRRYIYIHGAPEAAVTGAPASIGCIRMRNADVIDLFERVVPGTKVHIHE